MKIFSIVGARPQFIKVAALHRVIKKKNAIDHFILHTGQHYDYNLSKIFFDQLEIPKPDFELNINEEASYSFIERSRQKIFEILVKEQPNVVIVYGDTNSTLAGAMA